MTVLIIDDESIVRVALARACQSRGHEVFQAAGGTDGLKQWRQRDPDLVFVDVLMPDMNGPKVIESMGESNQAKVVLMSAYTGGYDLNKAQSAGADLFIPKPFDNIFETVKVAESICYE